MKRHLNPNIAEGIQYLGLGLVGYFCFYVFMNAAHLWQERKKEP